ncbi:MAG: PIN domain-containing protein [Candidatus Yonathbacteria bacterium]|nr:PIN domain-containing protein [Candidatus Yonathbacteria bacterium]
MTIDANIIIAYLAGDQEVVEALSQFRQEGKILILPTVVEAEVLSSSGWTKEERLITESFLEENFTSIPLDRHIAKVSAEIRRETKLKFPDAAIAATALFANTPLITRNIRDFKKVPGLSLLKI